MLSSLPSLPPLSEEVGGGEEWHKYEINMLEGKWQMN